MQKEQTKDSLEALIRTHAEDMTAFACSLTGNQDEARDIVQEAFTKAWRHLEKYDRMRPFGAWLRTIVKNLFLDRKRMLSSRKTVLWSNEMLNEDIPHSFSSLLYSQEEDMLTQLERKETVKLMRTAVRQLKTHHQEVISLCDLEYMEYRDAAKALGIPVGTVRSRMHRARRSLREGIVRDGFLL